MNVRTGKGKDLTSQERRTLAYKIGPERGEGKGRSKGPP